MTGIGIAVIGLFVSAVGIMIERVVNHDPAWLMLIILIGLCILLTGICPYTQTLEVRIPECVEKTSFLLAVKDNKYGVLTTDNIGLWNTPTNDIVTWQRHKYNLYGGVVETLTGTADKNETAIKEVLTKGVTNENSYIR